MLRVLVLLLLPGILLSQESWTVELPTIGTFSSPRVADLNQDGVKDIILGGGRLEFEACDTAMFALDGMDGTLLWHIAASDQIFGSAALMDINEDGVEDIFLSGRSSELKAISGKTGEVIWKFDTLQYLPNHIKRWFNFYNPQVIYDVDKDGLKDLLISNGGDIWVEPFDPKRASGRIVIISSASGKLLYGAPMPDDKEIYMSVSVLMNEKEPEKSKIIFGTGGETIEGNLFVGTIEMILKGTLSKAKLLAKGQGKGFISPPVWVDVNEDGQPDIAANSVNGRIFTFDGQTFEPIWETKMKEVEAYSSMAVGQFNGDRIPDFFVSFAQGVWPELSFTKQAMLNGQTGEIEYSDSLGYYQTSSPLAVDITGDGIDEVVLSVDYQLMDTLFRKTLYTTLYAIEFTQKQSQAITEGLPGHNVSSTPWLGDLNDDGLLDIIYCHGTNAKQTYTFDGLRVNCLKTTIPIPKNLKWGSYMGSNYNGVFR